MVLPAPDGPTSATVSPGSIASERSSKHSMSGARRIAKRDVVELDLHAAAGARKRARLRRVNDVGARRKQFHQPLGRTRGAHDIAPHLGEHRDARCDQHHVQHRLGQFAE